MSAHTIGLVHASVESFEFWMNHNLVFDIKKTRA